MALRRWQTRIEIIEWPDPDKPYQLVCIYGETMDKLRSAVQAYLFKRQLARFRNVGDHIVGRISYFYSTELLPVESFRSLTGGLWWYQEEGIVRGQIEEQSSRHPKPLTNFWQAVRHFMTYALIPEKGPDYQSRAMAGNDLRLPLLEKVLREGEEHPINDLIQRGWHIVALEYKGELSITGELMNRKAIFVLGHPEGQAATTTLDAKYYRNV